MIYTVTLNPALDYVMEFKKSIELGITNRSEKEYFYTGGKGVMVSSMLSNLEAKSVALGFLGGFTGKKYEELLKKNFNSIQTKLLFIDGDTRINPKLKADKETELNGKGPNVTANDLKKLEEMLFNLTSDDIVVLAGSIAPGIEKNWYVKIAQELNKREIKFIVDIADSTLLEIIKYRPLMVKPNHHEIADILGRKIETENELIAAGKELQSLGAENVIISRGGDGAILIDDEHVLKSISPKGKVIDTVGSGDSMVAGFTYGYVNKKSIEETFRLANACGSATAFSKHIGDKLLVEKLLQKVEIEDIK